jgi:ArsR family transcriptional regulator
MAKAITAEVLGPSSSSSALLNETSKLFKALAQPDRLRILQLLVKGELCQCELIEHLAKSQSTVSIHLRHLVEQGVLNVREDGQRRMYSIADSAVRDLLASGQGIVTRTIRAKAARLGPHRRDELKV